MRSSWSARRRGLAGFKAQTLIAPEEIVLTAPACDGTDVPTSMQQVTSRWRGPPAARAT